MLLFLLPLVENYYTLDQLLAENTCLATVFCAGTPTGIPPIPYHATLVALK